MADIKVKENKKGKIKTINKAVVGTQKIKNNVLDKNKQITEINTKEENISATEYAIEKSKNAIKNASYGTKQANKIGLQSFKQTRKNLQKIQNDRKIKQEVENYQSTQNIYNRSNKANKFQESHKSNAQKSNIKDNIKIKNVANNQIKTTKYTKGTIKNSKNLNKKTIKTAEATGKNIKNTTKTTIKTTKKAIQVAKETIVKTAKSVKAISKAIATTVKATVNGTKALITAIIAGGWVIIIIIVLLLSITALLYNSSENNDIVTVALSQVGNVGGEPYWSWYGFDSRVEWCATFVSWCANECGYIEKGIIPKFAGCELQGVSWFKSHDLWIDGGAIPQAGYIVFFDWKDKHDGKADHVRNCAEI